MKVVENFEFKRAASGKTKRDWDSILDGQQWQLDAEDFNGAKPSTVAMQARKYAKRKGMVCRISIDKQNETLTLQAVKAETNGETPVAKKPKKKTS